MTREDDAKKAWREHCKSAVRKFVMTAVVIDNEAKLDSQSEDETANKPEMKVAVSHDDGLAGGYSQEANDSQCQESDLSDERNDTARDNELYIRPISDAFAEEGITCSFVLPNRTITDKPAILERTLKAATISDIVIIDWYLSDKDPAVTKEILEKIARDDTEKEKGRLRLICVYTGQTDHGMDTVLEDACAALEKGGLKFDHIDKESGSAQGKHYSLIVLSKKKVSGNELPPLLLDALADIAEGLLPSFALAAVAAIRRNVHHIITRFPRGLDAAYVANRLITDPPGDVAQLLRELFVSECDTALGLEKVADNYLGKRVISDWLKERPVSTENFKIKNKPVDREFLECLNQNGFSGKKVIFDDNNPLTIKEEKRSQISFAIHGSAELAKEGERAFARLVALKREAFGNTKIVSDNRWRPSLTLGTILSQEVDAETFIYYYCLTPACDTVRLYDDKRKFILMELKKANEVKGKKTNLIIGHLANESIKLFFDPQPYLITTFWFEGDQETGRVMAEASPEASPDEKTFYFNSADSDPVKLQWLGEVRRNRATRDMAELNRQWLQFGIGDSEYLRLAAKGSATL